MGKCLRLRLSPSKLPPNVKHARYVSASGTNPASLCLARSTKPRIPGILGHQIDENGEAHVLTHKLGENGFCAEHLPVRDFLSPETLQLIEYCRDNGLMKQLGILGNV